MTDDGAVVAMRPKQRSLLAVLLVHANRVVPTDQMIEQVWNGRPPADAARVLHVHLSQLRRALHPRSPGRSRDLLLVRKPPGYLLSPEPGTLDLQRFEELVTRAGTARTTGDDEEAAACLKRALALWRGAPLANVDIDALRQAVAPKLEELRLGALEERIDADLRCGRHGQLIGELRQLVVEHPTRERLSGLLMLALYRAGRQVDALGHYVWMRDRLVQEFGVEPGDELQRLHHQILATDAALDIEQQRDPGPAESTPRTRVVVTPVPRQLPCGTATFTGRERDLERLRRPSTSAAGQAAPVAITAIAGPGGTGKSALAIHAAHQLAPAYPDGQLYIDLRGTAAGGTPLPPLETIGRLLRALGMESDRIPGQVDEAAAGLRSLAAGRRLLLVLDNARDAGQVGPLLIGSAGCRVLVTSRRVLAGLNGADHIRLDPLPEPEALTLLGRLAGAERIAAEPRAAAAVVRWCAGLPLAVCIAGTRLALRPSWRVATLAERLADPRRRLDELEIGSVGVRANVEASHRQLWDSPDPVDRAAARALGRLHAATGPDLSPTVAACLLGRPSRETERMLERLVDAGLLDTHAPGRYRMPDHARLYASEQQPVLDRLAVPAPAPGSSGRCTD